MLPNSTMKSIPNLPFEAIKESKDHHVTLRIRSTLRMAIIDRCEKLGTTRTSFIEDLIEKAIEGS
jgi:predicted DNA binding CopG/RHH family protein